MTNHSNRVRVRLAFVAMCVAALATLGWSTTVSAHTDFEASVPADGVTVDGPLSTVTVEFTNPAVESGDGFQLLEPDGTVRTPESLDPTNGTSFVATFTPALEAGTYGFRWEVQAGDAHPLQGSFQFTVTGPPTTTTAPSASTPVTSAPAATPAVSSPPTTEVDHSTMAMDEFLADTDSPGPFFGRAARTISMTSTVFAVGVIAALAWVIRGRRDELERLRGWVRLAGLGLLTGGLMALAALDETQSDPLTEIVTTKPGVAAFLTMAAGVLVVAGFGSSAGRIAGLPRPLSAAVAVDELTTKRPERAAEPDTAPENGALRWVPDRTAAVGVTGLALALAGYWFDGHTVSRGPWIVHGAVNLVHVAAASVWVGGVFAMTLVAWMRTRRRSETDLGAMVVRFSTIAGISLAALSGAGLVMAWLVLDAPGDLFSTDWGQVLLVKVGVVALAAGLGGYNHFVLRPALESRRDDPGLAVHLRRSLLVEAAVMAVVVVITAVLVASST